MSFQWTVIATFLYAEIGMVLLLLLPFISPTKWQKVLKSRILQSLEKQSNIYFNVFIVVLVLFFLDAIRDVRRFTAEVDGIKHDTHSHFESDLQTHMKLFRAQRNFYIAGFALFLWLVLRRLVTLISAQAALMMNNEAALKQAKSASDTATQLMKEREQRDAVEGETADNKGNIAREGYEKELCTLQNQLAEAKEELKREKGNVESMKRQAEAVSKEYDRLLEDHGKLQMQLEAAKGIRHDKKGE